MNDNERWLRELAQVANDEKQAEEALLDPRWDRLSAGDLSPDEEAALRALAGASEEGRTAYEAFRPLGPEFQARVVQALRDQNAQRSPAPVPEPVPDPPAPVLSFRRRARRISAWLGSVAAAAAVLFLMVHPPLPLPPLPGYTTPSLSGGVQAMRGAGLEKPGVFVSGSTFDLVLTPQTAVSGKVEVRCFLERGAELRPLPVPEAAIQNVGDGALRIHGTVGREIVIPPGAWTLWAVVGRPRALPDAETLRARLARGRPRAPDWEALKIDLKAE